ncbi:MAG: tRNA (adenosine(37)-N6)-threonylcarbamoyltransferase complex dimerization subunit type 1 TsaB [Methylobacteriaceae bacterium]|nr:tRNA (adenosine(37)-N6)-threonylcarbamoyltransferase complex dimerization subunit type 1 TsaB [Methylobacteriaceae bacterium]
MKILAIDTALGATAACVMQAGADAPESAESILMQRGHAEALMPLVARVLALVEGGLASIDRIAVTVGPGSFTGIRVGVAAARALGLARGVPVVGVSTLSALAAPLIADRQPGLVAVAIDARHGNIFVQAYASGGRTLLSPRLAGAREAMRALGAGPVRVAGSGAPALAAEAWHMGLKAEIVGPIEAPDIAYVARLGLLADPAAAPARPLYLKAPDAKPPPRPAFARAPGATA